MKRVHYTATSKAHPNVVIGNASQNHHMHLFLYEKKPFQFMIFKNFFGSAEILFRDTNMLGSGGGAQKQSLQKSGTEETATKLQGRLCAWKHRQQIVAKHGL